MRFICSCLEFVKGFFPPVAQGAFQTAKDYWFNKSGNVEALESMRVACWEYLEGKSSGANINDREDAAIRALICCLYAVPSSDDFSAEAVRWFIAMLNKVGDFSAEVTPLMEAHNKSH